MPPTSYKRSMKLLLIAASCLLRVNKAKHFLVELESSLNTELAKENAKHTTGGKDTENHANRRAGKDYGFEESGNIDEVFEGDMILTKEQRKFMSDHVLKKGQKVNPNQRNAIVGKKYLWPKNTLTYRFHSALSDKEKNIFRKTLEYLQSKLTNCIRIEERSSGYAVLIKNEASKGCQSYVGYHEHSWQFDLSQDLNLVPGCYDTANTGSIQHELLHALGLHHAQSRSDRDKYIEIKKENIMEKAQFNFARYEPSAVSHYDLPYDFGSVMHYGGTAASKNGELTIRTLDPSKQDVIGQREGISEGDIELLKKHYGCKTFTPDAEYLEERPSDGGYRMTSAG